MKPPPQGPEFDPTRRRPIRRNPDQPDGAPRSTSRAPRPTDGRADSPRRDVPRRDVPRTSDSRGDGPRSATPRAATPRAARGDSPRTATPRVRGEGGTERRIRPARKTSRVSGGRAATERAYPVDAGRVPRAAGPARQVDPAQPRVSPHAPRTKRKKVARPAKGNTHNRMKIMFAVLVVLIGAAAGRLVWIQAVGSSAYASQADKQRERTVDIAAQRGAILDRNGVKLAFTIEGRVIAARPDKFANDTQRQKVADILVAALGSKVDGKKIMSQLRSGKSYVYLVRGLLPAQTTAIMAQIKPLLDPEQNLAMVEVAPEDIRQYPDATLASTLVGKTGWDGHGLDGMESKFDSLLSGVAGSRQFDVDRLGNIIPGTVRNQVDAQNGSDLSLTLDSDLQYAVMDMLEAQVKKSGAKSGKIIVTDVKTGQVYALGNYVQGEDPKAAQSNKVVTDTFEPGSVMKVVTMAAALEAGLVTPDTVLNVDGEFSVGGTVVHDAWPHGPIDMTLYGILGKSSNVGTLMVAEQVGQDKFASMMEKLGLGAKTGIEIGGEVKGSIPTRDKATGWSSTTFANLPIGQGIAMSLVQLASMYQAIGNGGVRIPPTIIKETTTNGVAAPSTAKAGTRVMSKKTAATMVDMLRAPIQDGDMSHRGTAPGAAITGYQVAGKTGTAQQVDQACKCYSNTNFNATFAGLVPADNPRFSIAIMLDAPQEGSEGGQSAAPLFHDVAAYAMRAFDVEPSAEAAPIRDLYKNVTG